MKFDEQKAKEAIRQYGLNQKTIKVWKTRGAIPDKYTDADYVKRTRTKAGAIKQERLVTLLKSETVNITELAALTGIAHHKFAEAISGNTQLSDADTIKCITELKRLKLFIAKTFKTYSGVEFRKLTQHPLIHYSKIITSKNNIYQIGYIRTGKRPPEIQVWEAVKNDYIIFALTLNI